VLDLSIERDVDELNPMVGKEVVFSLTIENVGGLEATDIVVIDNIPPAFDLIGVEGIPSVGTTVLTTNSVEWTIPSLDFGETAILEIRVRVNPDSEADANGYTNSVMIMNSLGEVLVDNDPENDEDDLTLVPNCVIVNNLISPNNDGENDELIIDCIGDFPGNSIKIYNRSGKLIYKTKNYHDPLNRWRGQSNRSSLIDIELIKTTGLISSDLGKTYSLSKGTYYYILDLNNGREPLAGWIYLETPK
jgi:gliding motility-associated-like protein/uncharacterized repeat protein (TIGR01451 family)